jgi:hypothetical protein
MRTLSKKAASCQEPSKKENKAGYYPHLFVLVPFPYQDPKSMAFTREYGGFSISFTSRYGVPSGKAPRSLLAMIVTRYVFQHNDIKDTEKRRVITLGSLSDAARAMGYQSLTGGKTGTATKINKALEQMISLMIDTTSTRIIEQYQCFRTATDNIRLFDRREVWWNVAQKSDQPEGESILRISPEFEEIILNHAVPIDINVFNSLSAREQDLYTWAVRRVFAINKGKRKDIEIPYDLILPQFFDNTTDRRSKPKQKAMLLDDLLTIKKVYPELKVDSTESGLILHPSRLHIVENAKGFL